MYYHVSFILRTTIKFWLHYNYCFCEYFLCYVFHFLSTLFFISFCAFFYYYCVILLLCHHLFLGWALHQFLKDSFFFVPWGSRDFFSSCYGIKFPYLTPSGRRRQYSVHASNSIPICRKRPALVKHYGLLIILLFLERRTTQIWCDGLSL